MQKLTLRIATRKSKLALWQSEWVIKKLKMAHPSLKVQLIPLSTKGDEWLNKPLAEVGGKGLFVKELEDALLSNKADIAVHSLKDVPTLLPDGLILSTYLPRENPQDAFLSLKTASLMLLKEGALIGTSSLRRKAALLSLRPDLNIKMLRGNIDTRIQKLKSGEFDAIILAAAGIRRLNLIEHLQELLPVDLFLPAIGQGILAIESQKNTPEILALLAPLNHPETETCARAERSLNRVLQGGCEVPIAGHATLTGDTLTLHGWVASPDGKVILKAQHSALREAPEMLGEQVAQMLINQGAKDIIDALTE